MTTPDLTDQNQELQIQMPPEVQRGDYANQMLVTHTQKEFVLDLSWPRPLPASLTLAC